NERTLIAVDRFLSFSFNEPATTEIYTLSLHDALPILADTFRAAHDALDPDRPLDDPRELCDEARTVLRPRFLAADVGITGEKARSEEHTSELQSLAYLVCRLLLEKKKNYIQQLPELSS